MSARNSILNALATKLKEIDGESPYSVNLFNNVVTTRVFLDEVVDYPTVSMSVGPEDREYRPGGLAWGYIAIRIWIYTKEDDNYASQEQIIADIDTVLKNNGSLEYSPGKQVTDIQLRRILTDEGVLYPLGVAELLVAVRYDVY